MLLQAPLSATSKIDAYRFAGVQLDLRRAELRIDDVAVAAQALPLKLLRVLCESGGALVVRRQLFDALWPRQEISDEALTKLISRTRELLGPYGHCLVTLRGQGVRLDAVVLALQDSGPEIANARGADAAEVAQAGLEQNSGIDSASLKSTRARPLRWMRGVALGSLLAIVAGFAYFQSMQPAASFEVIAGYSLRSDDLAPISDEALALLAQAEQARSASDNERYRTFLRHAARAAPQSPAIPAVLSLSYRLSDPKQASLAAEQAAQSLRPTTPTYARLFVEYAVAVSQQAPKVRSLISSLLAMRPTAWRLQLSLAHFELGERRYPAALTALRQVPVRGPSDYTIYVTLADRASLGEGSVVDAALASGVLADAPIYRELLAARMAWTRSEVSTAIAAADMAADLASHRQAYSDLADAKGLAALFAYATDQPDAEARLRDAAADMRIDGPSRYSWELKALAAELALERGDRETATSLMRGSVGKVLTLMQQRGLEAFNARLGLLPSGSFAAEDTPVAQQDVTHGEPAFVQAWQAWASGDFARSRALLATARAAGIAGTYHAEDAALLGARLGEAASACRVDPPYPNYLRFSACRALARLAQTPASVTN